MDFETFARIVGESLPTNPKGVPYPDPMTGMPTLPKYTIEELYALFHADPITIATSEDFFVYDGTQPSEKAFLAQSLQEILMSLMQDPNIAAMLGYGPEQIRALFDQIYLLRGVTPAVLPPSMPATPPPQNVLPGPGVQQQQAALPAATSTV